MLDEDSLEEGQLALSSLDDSCEEEAKPRNARVCV
jgi:hypothetical protein